MLRIVIKRNAKCKRQNAFGNIYEWKNEQLALANQFAKESLKYECRYRSGGPERFTTNKNTQSMIHKVSDTN